MLDPRFGDLMALPQKVLDEQLSPSRSAKDPDGVLCGIVAGTARAHSDPTLKVTRDFPYGPHPRQRMDVFAPLGFDQMPCLAFIHGGFWQIGDKSWSGFAARTFANMGWASAAIGYRLTPDVSLTALTHEIHDVIEVLQAQAPALGIDPARIVLAGHSAGGHLAATVLADILSRETNRLICGGVLISGVYELAPIARSYVNDNARITTTEETTLSPLRFDRADETPVHLLIGADEPDAFQVQSDVLRDHWASDTLSLHRAAGRDHFDILHALTDRSSPTVQAILKMI